MLDPVNIEPHQELYINPKSECKWVNCVYPRTFFCNSASEKGWMLYAPRTWLTPGYSSRPTSTNATPWKGISRFSSAIYTHTCTHAHTHARTHTHTHTHMHTRKHTHTQTEWDLMNWPASHWLLLQHILPYISISSALILPLPVKPMTS